MPGTRLALWAAITVAARGGEVPHGCQAAIQAHAEEEVSLLQSSRRMPAAARGHAGPQAGKLSKDGQPGGLTPGWLFERLFHTEAIACPWQSPGDTPDEDCRARLSRIDELRNAIGICQLPLKTTPRSIGHRGSPLIAPEETEVSWQLAVEQGAGYLECDAAVTKDLELICRHSACDLDFTTNLVTDFPEMNEKCSVPFVPGSGKKAKCCTYDFTMEEQLKLCAVMESKVNESAATLQGYLVGPPGFRTGAIANQTCHKMVSYKAYLALLKEGGYHAIPELKDTTVGATEDFLKSQGKDIYWLAEKFATEMYDDAGFEPWPPSGPPAAEEGVVFGILQTFDNRIATHWKKTGGSKWTVEYMWESVPPEGQDCAPTEEANSPDCGGEAMIKKLNALGVDMFSPPVQLLIANGTGRTIVPSATAEMLKANNVRSIGSWSLERQGCSRKPMAPFEEPLSPQTEDTYMAPCWNPEAWYFSSVDGTAAFQHADVLVVLDVLFKDVGIESVFSDFPATVSAYVNCVFEPSGYGTGNK